MAVKHIHIQADEQKHTELKKIKEQHGLNWLEMLEKAKEKMEG